jgi:hypothetical protein
MKHNNRCLLGICLTFFLGIFPVMSFGGIRVIQLSDYGVMPDFSNESNASPKIEAALDRIRTEVLSQMGKDDSLIVRLLPGTYHFHPEGSAVREYYISNHDQTNPKHVGICLENFRNLTLDGGGAIFIFHGQMLPIALLNSKNCTLRDFTIDFSTPHVAQAVIVENSDSGIRFRPSEEVNVRLDKDSTFCIFGEGWEYRPSFGTAFEKDSRHIVYNTSDINIDLKHVRNLGDGTYLAPQWKDSRLPVGARVAMRTGNRPAPGIFMEHDVDTRIESVSVCYAEGMGLLAECCENITLDRFAIPTSELNHERYFTTQADATHFSGCKGRIVSVNGYYTGMMDDAINVHGTYLRVVKRVDDHTLEARYMHDQSWGFFWGERGDSVQFIASETMETVGRKNMIKSISAVDKPVDKGVRVFRIEFKDRLPREMKDENAEFGVENLTWTPEVVFSGNYISNNRARGALFSTPRKVVVEDNVFDHVAGCAILLCGDCNGWFETGACHDVAIRRNRFINVLTSMYQFTNAIISIYPEIPDLEHQRQYFHGGRTNAITIEDNTFETFDMPLLYAKSVDGLLFRGNKIIQNNVYPAFHWNKQRVLLEHVINYDIEY